MLFSFKLEITITTFKLLADIAALKQITVIHKIWDVYDL